MDVITRINDVTAALQAGGLRADRGYPAQCQSMPSSPVVTVTVAYSNEKETALQVCVLGPMTLGGRVCEDLAQTAAQLLRETDACCRVGGCRFDEEMRLFAVDIVAVWQEYLTDRVMIGDEALEYVTDISTEHTRQVAQVTDEETGLTVLMNETVGWTVTVWELLPFDTEIGEDAQEAFTLKIIRESGTETYPQCYWTSITLEKSDNGRLRKRVAQSWSERVTE